MATLTISHYIYLTKKQRYDLHEGHEVNILGVSVPVWFDKGSTSEPAKEVFCKYKLTNEKLNQAIIANEEGYHINLPQKQDLSNQFDSVLNFKIPTSDKLLDTKDGGVESLEFRQYNKIHKDEYHFNVVHFVEIKPHELLLETLS